MKRNPLSPLVKKAFSCTLLLAALLFASCDYWGEDWYKSGESSSSSGGSVTYGGTYVVNGKAYSSLTMTGTDSSGTVVLAGDSGSLTGSYASAPSAASAAVAARALSLNNGSYTITLGDSTLYLDVTGSTSSDQGHVYMYIDSSRKIQVGTSKSISSADCTMWKTAEMTYTADPQDNDDESGIESGCLLLRNDGTWDSGYNFKGFGSGEWTWYMSTGRSWKQEGNTLTLDCSWNAGDYIDVTAQGKWSSLKWDEADEKQMNMRNELLSKGYVEGSGSYWSCAYVLAGDTLYGIGHYVADNDAPGWTVEGTVSGDTLTLIKEYDRVSGKTYVFAEEENYDPKDVTYYRVR